MVGVTFPEGFLASGVSCGIKDKGLDLGILFSERKAHCAGVFTTNRVKGAHVKLCMDRLSRAEVFRAVVVNSGNANACTGKSGVEDAGVVCKRASELLGVSENEVLMASTGIIGVPLPVEKILGGLREACSKLSRQGGLSFSRAIMTTDKKEKNISLEVSAGLKSFKIGGSAKGAGMIFPRMATMLSFITTDLEVEPKALSSALKEAVSLSFNRISVDGDTSPNDTVIIMANGASGIRCTRTVYRKFREGLLNVCTKLSRMIVEDGEGATKVIHIVVSGAASKRDAEKVCFSLSRSLLFKTAMFGCDPNWGRIVTAVGYSGAKVLEESITVVINGITVYKGLPVHFDEDNLKASMEGRDIEVRVDLGLGGFSYEILTTDLSYDYVRINAEYRT